MLNESSEAVWNLIYTEFKKSLDVSLIKLEESLSGKLDLLFLIVLFVAIGLDSDPKFHAIKIAKYHSWEILIKFIKTDLSDIPLLDKLRRRFPFTDYLIMIGLKSIFGTARWGFQEFGSLKMISMACLVDPKLKL